MITLKFHQILQLLDFVGNKLLTHDEQLLNAPITVKPLHEANGDIGLYAWLADHPEAGSVKLEAEAPDDLMTTIDESLDAEDAMAGAMIHTEGPVINTGLLDAADIRLAANLTATDYTFEDAIEESIALDFSKHADGACFGL